MSIENIEKNQPDTLGHDAPGDREEDFAAMLDKNSLSRRLAPGEKVKAKVVSISGDLVYIDIGGKSEGAVDLTELVDEEGAVCVREGEEIEASFVTVQDGLMKLTTRIGGYSAVTLHSIRDAHEAGIPVNGKVKRELRGGFEVSVNGVRCFCPFSHIDLRGSNEEEGYVGRTFPFRILEYGEEGKRIILSRRELLVQQEEEKRKKLRESLSEGIEVNAVVKSIRKFGAFADLGGVEGLIPASEISWDRDVDPGSVLSVGQKITVKIISLDWEKNRITLSLKALHPDPWDAVSEKYPVDSRVSGPVARLAPFGVFVKLEPGIEGLIHISNLGAGRRISHPGEVVELGQWVDVYVLSVEGQSRRISLSMQPKAEPVKIVLPAVGEVLEGIVEKIMPFGIFLRMPNGLRGLVPHSEAGTEPGTDHKRMFMPGSEIKAAVIEVDAANKKIRLSRRAFLEKAAQEEYTEYTKSLHESAGSSAFGSIGEILRAKREGQHNQG
ncbi:MAG: S1 RNA-binding domain-containing protein [Nitrospirota bacterium]